MRIIRLHAENLKKIRAVEITPTGSVVHLTGPNGSGKSSVLDAIYMALAGAKAIPSEPVRQGESQARVTLDLGEIVVTRKFKKNGDSSLTVEAASGARYPSPQSMLDALLGALAFDPLAFARMDAKAQLEALRGLVTVDEDIEALDRANAADYQARTERNRLAGDLKAQADAITVPDGLPADFVNVDTLLGEMERAASANADTERRARNREAMEVKVGELRDQAAKLRDQADLAEQEAADLQAKLDTAPPLPPLVDVAEVRAQIQQGQEINRHLEAKTTRRVLLDRRATVVAEAEDLTARMAERVERKRAAIARATMPVEGLAFGDGAVLFGGVPFAQASSAEQLRVSVAIAMAANPKLRVLRVKDGGLLDEASLALLTAMAEANDYQVWIETAGTHRPGIVMEDGAVKGGEA